MSDTVAPGPERTIEHDEIDQEATKSDLTPIRHDSKVDNEEDATADGSGQVAIADTTKDVEVTPQNDEAVAQNATVVHVLNTEFVHRPFEQRNSKPGTPVSAGLYIQTHLATPTQATLARLKETPILYETPVSDAGLLHALNSPSALPILGSSLRSNLSTSSLADSMSQGSGSALPSPYLAAMSDLTPLPSPIVGSLSSMPISSRRSLDRLGHHSRSRASSVDEPSSVGRPYPQYISSTSPPKKRKAYGSLLQGAVEANAVAAEEQKQGKESHGRHRSISDFVPEQLHNFRHRHVTFGLGDAATIEASEYHMHREAYLANKRGLTIPLDPKHPQQFPTPPPSSSSVGESDGADDDELDLDDSSTAAYFEIHCGLQNKRRKFRQIRQLGQGTFSTVVLATRERIPAHSTPEIEAHLDPHKLVAVKIVEHGPAGGADEQRIMTGLKREVEMLKSISHPSLIHLKACEYQHTRALLVLTYCPGGDLFELASQKRGILTARMVRRVFSELVSAVRYLHANWIVHRDIKLENVLVNLPSDALKALSDPLSHATPLVTLTDLGLSRRIPDPPESPLLTTRCGSEDYAAPEILLGQPYDGRQTDAWALGVLLYALMEGRLPFDAPPGKPDRSRNTHRIARCDWIWCRFGDEDGDWDPSRPSAAEFEGGRVCVESLLKKVRMGRKSLEDIKATEWVRSGIQVSGGLTVRSGDDDDMAML